MKIKQVRIQDFRGIEDLSLDFGSDNINVIIGVNGVGKSSVIDCLCLLLSEYVRELRKVFKERKLQQSLESSYIIGVNCGPIGIQNMDSVTTYYNMAKSTNNNGSIQNSRKPRNKIDDIRNGANSSILEVSIGYNQKYFAWSKPIELSETQSTEASDESDLVDLINEIVPSYSTDFSIPLVLC
jgi:AAA15 family ATPase/GTPase